MSRCTPIAFLALAIGCAPAYRPPAPFAPLLDQKGDLNAAAHLGTGGVQVDAAYALQDSLSLRAGFQGAGYASQSGGLYAVGTFGPGAYGRAPNGGALRWGVALVGGGGISKAVSELTITSGTGDAVETSTTTFRNSGGLVVVALRPEVGLDTEFMSMAFTAGVSYHSLFHDADSDGTGRSDGLLIEPAVVFRAGPEPVHFGGFLGLALPLMLDENAGIPFPVLLGVTVSANIPTGPPEG